MTDGAVAGRGPTEALAAFAATVSADAVTDRARDAALMGLFDAAACMLAGSASDTATPLLAFARSRGGGTVPIIGTDATADPATAALINGTFGHALDYDDVLSIIPGHPSVVILPALLAMAPPGTSGDKLVEAYVIGLEVAARIGVAIGNGHYRRGFHATGTLVIFAAVAALGRLLGLDTLQLRQAFGVAGSMSSGLLCNFGTMTKPLHAGWAAHNAITAVSLVRAGMTANADVFEAESGFFSTYGTEQSDVSRAADGLGSPWAVESPGLSLKNYPCCYALHRAIDAMRQLRRDMPLSPDTVANVVCRVAPGALRPLIHARPRTGLEAKFSLEYTLAAGVLDGRFDLAAYSDAGALRPAVQALLPLMDKIEDPRCLGDEASPQQRSAGTLGFVEVTATLRDGSSRTVRIDKPIGSPERPLGWDDLATKFADCAREAGLSPEQGAAAAAQWRDLRALDDVQLAVRALTRGAQ